MLAETVREFGYAITTVINFDQPGCDVRVSRAWKELADALSAAGFDEAAAIAEVASMSAELAHATVDEE
jgi:hypothetical protein